MTTAATVKSAPLHIVLGGGITGMSCAQYLQQSGRAFAMIEPNKDRLSDLQERLNEAGLSPAHLVSDLTEAEPLLARADQLICSPGISPRHEILERAQRLGVALCSDLDLFMEQTQAPVVAITGTNGKSTVTTLLGQMAQAAGLDVGVGGNLGVPALSLLRPATDLYVLEISSFQLEYCRPLKLTAAAMLNLHFDHLDRHGNLRRYGEVKRSIFHAADRLIYNRQDALTQPPMWAKGERISLGLDEPTPGQYGVRNGHLCRGSEMLMPLADLGWSGPGQIQNALAALALGESVGLKPQAMYRALAEFGGLPHRCQTILQRDRVRWIDDSKSTNPASAAASIQAVSAAGAEAIVLIAGGDIKGVDPTALARAANGKVSAALLIGEDAGRLAQVLRGICEVHLCEDLPAAVRLAGSSVHPGEAVLLAPGCASGDEFVDYRQRGELFAQYARELAA